jgi:hypothetical protein
MNCARCGRPFALRKDTPVMEDSRCRIRAWGPKCAKLAGLTKPKRRATKPPAPARARAFAGQIDWIEEGIEA